ncbi:hypothetical protein NDU88_002086 [Pleurodeles waltl]|uniref:Uncharacterized protein n=1 Tax=Pleurodeles waltl TaxID=8319 RepID=A0AAV7UXB1_PLEWA|nr:hypothetical protein NDU88_002086 [Pleurodeles waltl]
MARHFEDFMKGAQVTEPEQRLIALRNLVDKDVGQIIKYINDIEEMTRLKNQKNTHKRWRLKKYPRPHIQMGKNPAKFALDSGASLFYICVTEYNKMNPKLKLQKDTVWVYAWMSKEPLLCLGQFRSALTYKKRTVEAQIHVSDGPETADYLLNLLTAERLKLGEILYKIY